MQKTYKSTQASSPVPQWLIAALLTVLGLFIIGYVGVGWYFSGKLFKLEPQKVSYDQSIQAVEGDSYSIKGSAYDIDGIVGGIRPNGSMIGVFEPPSATDAESKVSTRKLRDQANPKPAAGDALSLQGNMWITNPKEALGIDYDEVQYLSPVGAMDAWVIPGAKADSWTIGVHGIGAHKNEMLRFIKPVIAAGNTMMVINYRGDVGNPAPPDGRNHFGDTEWQDLETAVRYAKSRGAKHIQLYGTSLGGSITQNYLRRSADVSSTNITHVVLDSPALDWNEILRHRISKMGFPAMLSKPGKDFAKLRAGIDFGRITTRPGSIKHETLIVHNSNDTSVPQAASKRVAQAQPSTVTFVDFGSGGHIRAWNHDPARYESLVTNFLQQ